MWQTWHHFGNHPFAKHIATCAIQAVATRRLLQSAATDSAAVVQVQMTGKSENQTNQIAQELGTVVSNTNLQVLPHHASICMLLQAMHTCHHCHERHQ